jgi:hypothetical protein
VVPAALAVRLPGAQESAERRAAEEVVPAAKLRREVAPAAQLRREVAERALVTGRSVSPPRSLPGWAEWARMRPVPGDPEG